MKKSIGQVSDDIIKNYINEKKIYFHVKYVWLHEKEYTSAAAIFGYVFLDET